MTNLMPTILIQASEFIYNVDKGFFVGVKNCEIGRSI